MDSIHLILNISALLLWIGWLGFNTGASTTSVHGISLVTTIKRTQRRGAERWGALLGLLILLGLRPFFYWHLGTSLDWVPIFHPLAVAVPFRSDIFIRMLAYSFLEFAWVLGLFYLYVWFLKLLNHGIHESNPLQRLIERYAGVIGRLPGIMMLPFPFVFVSLVWPLTFFFISRIEIYPKISSVGALFGQGFILGIAVYMVLKWLAAFLVLFYMVNSYVYLGPQPLWKYLQQSGKRLMLLFRWLPLKFGKLDLNPLIVAPLLFMTASFVEGKLSVVFDRWNQPVTFEEGIGSDGLKEEKAAILAESTHSSHNNVSDEPNS